MLAGRAELLSGTPQRARLFNISHLLAGPNTRHPTTGCLAVVGSNGEATRRQLASFAAVALSCVDLSSSLVAVAAAAAKL